MALTTFLRLLIPSFALALLWGCAVTPPAEQTVPQKSTASLRAWGLEGKLGFRSPQKNGSAWVNWQQAGTDYNLRLSGPFGAKATQIQGNGNYAVLRQAGEQDLNAPDATALTERLFGWPLPVEQMMFWVKGSPASAEAKATYDSDTGQISTLTEDDWHLEYSDYQPQGSWILPGKIRGTRGEIGFTLIIKSWEVQSP